MNGRRSYTRWCESATGVLVADILGAQVEIVADVAAGRVRLGGIATLTADEARLYGVRLIEAAALVDRDAVRGRPDAGRDG